MARYANGVKLVFEAGKWPLPIDSVIRIDEVEKEGSPRIVEGDKDTGTLSPFPVPVYAPKSDPTKS